MAEMAKTGETLDEGFARRSVTCPIKRMGNTQRLKASFEVINQVASLTAVDWMAHIGSGNNSNLNPREVSKETKLQGDIQEIGKQIWGERWVMYACLEASGTREGIIMLWDSRVWKGEVQQIGVHTLTCSFEGLLQNFNCHITGVYAPNCNVERREVWDELGAVRGLMEGPWAVCEDFNVCRFPTERRNCQMKSTAMVEFLDFIEDLELIDLPLEGGTHTWFRGDTNNVASRIDRIIFTIEWSEQFSKMKQVALQRLTSNHVPIALHCGPWDLIKSYFKFKN
ncbi:hypothetical protein H5410_036874 [Solanum commersonii]|uniref:Endonuclease/exonuclease/phosphatase domain-containing protein n=1 Tax=Solanum commersonii TaxID=4109 RepID=A0A9J5Y6G6_SOLCO|nr:hypothetical protein H5410_036874 [Solanum commersonii]